MRRRHTTGWLGGRLLAGLVLVLACGPVRADSPQDPLRLVPDQANLVFKVEQPRKIADILLNHELSRQVRQIEAVQELYDSTNARRFYQLLAYFEKQLGMETLDMLDRLAGDGIVVAAKLGGKSQAALLVLQGRDEELMKKFVSLGLDVVEQELARQDIKGGFKKASYREVPLVQIDKARIARVGAALLLASEDSAMKGAIDCFKDGGKKSISHVPALIKARQMLPNDPLAWGWIHLEPLHAIPEFKEGIKTIALQPVFIPVVGPLVDVFERSPFVCAGIYQEGKNFFTTVRMARGRKDMSERAALLLPAEKEPGSMPLLKPANTLASLSFYLDLGKLWQNRAKVFPGKAEAKQLDQFEQNSGLFLGGVKLSTLFNQAGAHHRVVVVQQTKSSYKPVPQQPLPAFAWVGEMREAAFAKSMETVLRAAGLIASTQANLKMVEEKHGPYHIVSYRFPEDKGFPGDSTRYRFNFSPSFVKAGNQFIVSSTVELARELADMVGQERVTAGAQASSRWQFYAAGGAAALRTTQDQLRTQYILSRALSPKEAQEQVRQLIDLVGWLGVLSLETQYGADNFRLDIRLNLDK